MWHNKETMWKKVYFYMDLFSGSYIGVICGGMGRKDVVTSQLISAV